MPKSNRPDQGRQQAPGPDQPAAEPAEPTEPAEPRNRAERRAQRKGRKPSLPPPGDKGPAGGHHHDPVLIPRRSGRRGNR